MFTLSTKRGLRILFGTIAAAVILPTVLPAQNTGVAGDGTMRLMWTATDSHISLWKLDASLNDLGYHEYGPYYGWSPIALTTDTAGYSYILWRYTDGSISLWLVDPNLNFVNSRIYGPYTGWTAESLSVETSGVGNRFRVIWKDTDGKVSIWIVDGALNFVSNAVYGPFFGWTPSGATAARTVQSTSADVDKQASASMTVATGSATAMPKQDK